MRLGFPGVWRGESLKRHGRVAIGHDSKVISLLNSHGERLYRLLVRLCLREDVAEDLLQDLAVKLSQASSFAAAQDPYAYARKAAVNLAFSWIRSRQRERERTMWLSAHSTDEPPPWMKLVNAEDIRRVLEHMESLGDRDRLILAMRYFEEAEYEEIAQVIGSTDHQARALCHKAIERLRKAMVEPDPSVLEPRTEVEP
ncbi:MAG: sigma-70 family RNA polymerase sigma factor [Phycisphaerae bacterium]|nr:sigma-70 family RNA polymerase sigma factor [Phycisphaerae bacterium]HPP20831.1 sigma-70 family RNA polymerase sigma factor [Phycisphaerae bacterium]